MQKQLLVDIHDFDKKQLINRIEYPEKIRKWVYKNSKSSDDVFELATYICHSAGYSYKETKNGWILKENPGICHGCKTKTLNYICSKMFKRSYCFECWFDCDKTFI